MDLRGSIVLVYVLGDGDGKSTDVHGAATDSNNMPRERVGGVVMMTTVRFVSGGE